MGRRSSYWGHSWARTTLYATRPETRRSERTWWNASYGTWRALQVQAPRGTPVVAYLELDNSQIDNYALAAKRVQYYDMVWNAAQRAPLDLSLLPRLRRWFVSDWVPSSAIREWVRIAIGGVAQAPLVFGIALLRVWCDARATSYRKGAGADHCIFCWKAGSDRASDLARCRPLWSAAADASGVPTPANLRQALGLDGTIAMRGTAPKKSARAPAGIFLLTIVADVYHKLRARRRMGGRAHRPLPKAQVDAAVRHAMRRMWRP